MLRNAIAALLLSATFSMPAFAGDDEVESDAGTEAADDIYDLTQDSPVADVVEEIVTG